MLPVKVVV